MPDPTPLPHELEAAEKVINSVLAEASEKYDWRADNWNLDAHVELTLTIGELRSLAAAVTFIAECRQRAEGEKAEHEGTPVHFNPDEMEQSYKRLGIIKGVPDA